MHIATIHTPFPSLARVLQMPAAFMPDHSVGVVKPLVNILALVAQSRRTHPLILADIHPLRSKEAREVGVIGGRRAREPRRLAGGLFKRGIRSLCFPLAKEVAGRARCDGRLGVRLRRGGLRGYAERIAGVD